MWNLGAKPAPPDVADSPMADVIDLDDEGALKHFSQEASRHHVEMRRCRRCRYRYGIDEESAVLHKHWCHACEANWLERRFYRLIDRIGRRAALLALKRLLS